MTIIDHIRLEPGGSRLLGFICEREAGFMACTWGGALAWFASFDAARDWLSTQG